MPRLTKPIEFFYNEEPENYAATGNHYRSDIISNSNGNISDSNENISDSHGNGNISDSHGNVNISDSHGNVNISILLTLYNSIIKIFSGKQLNRNEYIYLGVFIIFFSSIMYITIK